MFPIDRVSKKWTKLLNNYTPGTGRDKARNLLLQVRALYIRPIGHKDRVKIPDPYLFIKRQFC